MKRYRLVLAAVGILAAQTMASAQSLTYSTGCVRDYIPNGCAGPDLPATIPEGDKFRYWYNLGGFSLVSRWENGDVWGSDFRDGDPNGGDLESQGGSDLPHVYLFAGHGACQNPPAATSPDFIITCGNSGTPNTTTIGTSSRWGNSAGNLRFAFIDASCPMDLVSITNQWWPTFRGLHVAVGHSGTSTADALDSDVRGAGLGVYTSGGWWLLPHLSVSDAWMAVGIDDVQTGCCAVVVASDSTEANVIDRRDNEKVKENRSDPSSTTWLGWRWICR